MDKRDSSVIYNKIKDTYVPFLRKLITFLEKTNKASPENLNFLKDMHTVFTTASIQQQVKHFLMHEEKLENWHGKINKNKRPDDNVGSPRKTKRASQVTDSDSSLSASDNFPSSRKKKLRKDSGAGAVENIVQISAQPCVSSVSNNLPSETVTRSQMVKESVESQKSFADTPNTISAEAKNPTPVEMSRSHISNISEAKERNDDNVVIPPEEAVNFACGTCEFETLDETKYTNHLRMEHKPYLSSWCKCGKYFCTTSLLISHIKEKSCVKQEMIYRCAEKNCKFETPMGVTFAHHLRHCHTENPFIFCIHCQKMFTLPHCLILHMQNDCTHKHKNIKNPIESVEPTTISITRRSSLNVVSPEKRSSTSPNSKPPLLSPAKKIPGKESNKGTRKSKRLSKNRESDEISDSSERQKQTRASTRSKHHKTYRNFYGVLDLSESSADEPMPALESSVLKNLPVSEKKIQCPCCSFVAPSKSELEDHYIANHKISDKNACLVCHLQFDNLNMFLEHFVSHGNAKVLNQSTIAESTFVTTSGTVIPQNAVQTNSSIVEKNRNQEIPIISFSLDDVVQKITKSNAAKPASPRDFKIPYQVSVHKNKKDLRLNTFEDLKSSSDLTEMKNKAHLMNFFKCVVYNCVYSCNNETEYTKHLEYKHNGKHFNCAYCFEVFYSGKMLANHTFIKHYHRNYQCSNCFYRAYSKIHVQIHIKNMHFDDACTEILVCSQTAFQPDLKPDIIAESLNTTWPFVCATGDCNFYTYDPKDFEKHNENNHRYIYAFLCHYCKVNCSSIKKLLSHYKLHGVNTYQCNYCIFGSETNDEIMLHLCNDHADLPLKAFVRSSEDALSTKASQLSVRNEGKTDISELKSGKISMPLISESQKRIIGVTENFEKEPHIVGMSGFPKALHHICSDLPCGIPCCQVKCEDIPSYIEHLKTIHLAINFCCSYCTIAPETWEDFKLHLMCHGPDLYACGLKQCDYYNWDANTIARHMKTHSDSNIEMIVVRECATENRGDFDLVKIKSLTLNNHPTNNHPQEKFECFFCKYKSSDFKVMKNHMYNEMAYKRFSCSLCSVQFLCRKEVTNHFKTSHSGCNVKCNLQSNLTLECLVKKYLKQKINIFTLQSVLKCGICNKEFEHHREWQSHVFACLRKEYQPYNCDYCKTSFSDLKLIKYHTDRNHFPKTMQYSVDAKLPVENEINSKLRDLRFKCLELFFKVCTSDNDVTNSNLLLNPKYYYCSICKYKADYKYNVEKHISTLHINQNAVVKKSTEKFEISKKHSDEKLNDSTKSTDSTQSSSNQNSNQAKRFQCGFCIKKLYTIEELKTHVESCHPVKDETEYFYYYSPNINGNCVVISDETLYECAYCKSNKGNLFTLKKHFVQAHSEMQFKVKGYVSRNKKECYFNSGLRLESKAEHKHHSTTYHPFVHSKSTSKKTISNVNKNQYIKIWNNKKHFSNLNQLSIRVKSKEGSSLIPVVHLTHVFNLFPKVILKDLKKEKCVQDLVL